MNVDKYGLPVKSSIKAKLKVFGYGILCGAVMFLPPLAATLYKSGALN